VNDRDFNELRQQVAELTRRVDDQAALVRKTQTSIASLADSLGQVVARQRKGDRRIHLNSFVAYLLFTVLLGGGFFALYNARMGNMVRERDDAVAARDAARDRVAALGSEVATREAAAKKAYDFYQLLRDNKGVEAIAAHADLDTDSLTPTERELFAQEVEKARGEIVDAGYLSGIDAFRKSDYERAVTELRRGLAYQSEGTRAAQMRYYLGVALHKKGDDEEAARQIELAMAGGVEQAGHDDARYYLAAALEQLGRYADARAEYDKFASANPKSPLAVAARRKSTQLARVAVPKN
jgi:TolA-binding protein